MQSPISQPYAPIPPPRRQYGKDFGKRYFLHDLVEAVPRVRVRTAEERAMDQLADLAALNERLAGGQVLPLGVKLLGGGRRWAVP